MKNFKNFLHQFVHNKGRQFYATILPDDIERGRLGDCFDHCLMQAAKSKGKYFYCEGMAYHAGEWFHHAWLTDKQGFVAFDPTWRAEDKEDKKDVALHMVHYLGAKLDLEAVMEFVVKTEYKSPLANHSKNPELAQKVYDSAR